MTHQNFMSKARKQLDETIKGGLFKTADGQLVNANGDFIDDAGNIVACRLPKNKPIKRFIIPEHKPYREVETKETVKIVDGHRLKKLEDFLVEKDWISNESATKKANEIFLEIESKYLSEIEKAKSDKKLDSINGRILKEYHTQLEGWLYPENEGKRKGRPLNSYNSNSHIVTLLKEVEKDIQYFSVSEGKRPPIKIIVEKHSDIPNDRTLRRWIRIKRDKTWIEFCDEIINRK